MNKRVHLAILVLVGLLTMMVFSGCQQAEESEVEVEESEVEAEEPEVGVEEPEVGVEKPSVGTVPEGWYLSDEAPYPEYGGNGNWGLIEYTDEYDSDFVQIWYGDLPSELEGKEEDRDALIGRAIYESAAFEPTDTGTMTIGDWLAGYAKAYDADYDVYDMEIVFVNGATCVDIYVCYDATSEDEEQAMSLIRSIYF